MEQNLQSGNLSQNINSIELLTRFVSECKEASQGQDYYPISLCSADILTAVYYYRFFPDVDEFIELAFKSRNNYFHLQWVRSMWNKLSKMSEAEVSNLVIKQITTVANSPE